MERGLAGFSDSIFVQYDKETKIHNTRNCNTNRLSLEENMTGKDRNSEKQDCERQERNSYRETGPKP